jgi:hypothetical protein
MEKQITYKELLDLQEKVHQHRNNLNHTQGQVMHLLENYPESRGNDGILLCLWLQTFKNIGTLRGLIDLANNNEFNFETIRRSRQRIQSSGLYLPAEDIIIKRRKLESVWRAVTLHEQNQITVE